VERNRLVDSRGQAFLIRGTQLPEFRTLSSASRSGAAAFGPHSATVFDTIRQRWNMNAVRLPLNLSDYGSDPKYLQSVGEVVRRANDLEVLVILAARDPDSAVPSERLVRFWRECSAFLRDSPQLIFELDSGGGGMEKLIRAVRAGGAKQPVVVDGSRVHLVDDANAIYLVSPTYSATRTDRDRDRQLGRLAARVPVLVSGLDPELARNSAECASLPGDPSEAEAVVGANLEYFDAHDISWVISEFRPGKLIGEYRNMFATSLESGWACGQPEDTPYGIGEVVQFHLLGGELRGLFAVSATGNFTVARGSVAIIYGGIFAEQDASGDLIAPATELGRVSVRVADSQGVERKAGLLWVSAGWGQANFVVPPDCAPGPALVTVERWDGTAASTRVTIADVAPGLWTAPGDGRGAVIGFVDGRVDGHASTGTPIHECHSKGCSAVAIPFAAEASTLVRLLGTGFRYTPVLSDIQVTIGGTHVPVLALGPDGNAGADRLIVGIPYRLRGAGETDLICSIRGRLSNVVRINLGPGESPR
jgi:uncharacterized protein (TIGR03437 family)